MLISWEMVIFGLVALKFLVPVITPKLILLIPTSVILAALAVTSPILFVTFESVIFPGVTRFAVPLTRRFELAGWVIVPLVRLTVRSPVVIFPR